jgi:hypothetical protein
VDSVLLALAALACPVAMGGMMWMTARGRRGDGNTADEQDQQDQVAQLRAEIERLKVDRAAQHPQGGQ